MARKAREKKVEVVGILGVGFDNEDGHKRLTRAEDFIVLGGSEQTHEKMQDVAIQFNESLKERGKRLQDAEPQEVIDLLRRALDR